MKILDADQTRSHLDFEGLVPALREAFAHEATVPPRHVHAVGAGDDRGTVLIMPAWSEAGFLGIKTINIFPGNGARGLPGLHATYLLYDAHTGVPLAQLDGNEITAHRTAAASALGASFLAREDASSLLVLGTGRVARLLPAAHASVRPIREVRVWNHRPEPARALATRLNEAGFRARASDDLAHATAQADIVSCATLSTAPLIHGEWLGPGTHLDLIGSFTPQMRESDAQCFARSRVFVDTPEALSKSGDVLEAIIATAFDAAQLQGTLGELCQGMRAGRAGDAEITLFKSVGTALEDLAAAELVFDAVAGESVS